MSRHIGQQLGLARSALAEACAEASRVVEAGGRWFVYQPGVIEFGAERPNEAAQRVAAAPVFLSAERLMAITKCFVWEKSTARLRLGAADGLVVETEAYTESCVYVGGFAHVTTLAFGTPLDPAALCGDRARPHGASAEDSAAAEPADPCAGIDALFLIQDEDEWEMLAEGVTARFRSVRRAKYLGAALDTLARHRPGLVVCDLEIDTLDAAAILERLARTRYAGPLLGLSYEPEAVPDELLPAAHVLAKPAFSDMICERLVSAFLSDAA